MLTSALFNILQLTNLKRNLKATGGRPSSVVALEQSTVELVSMQTHVKPNSSANGLENPEDSDGAESTFTPKEPAQTTDSAVQQLSNNRKASKK
ncbi:hypothetical protein DOY81_011516 [Sarcophaga bullata]|nr:hypothetical protein DOY81_011516 [Sarcophaga bullata]